MPLPTPRDGESQDEFESRCMGDSTMNDEYEDEDERYAVCSSQWERRNKESADQSSKLLKAESEGELVAVDREAGIIHGYVVAQEGPFKSEGRGEFDHKSLRMILGLMKSEKAGLKSRLGHPTMSDDGIGKFLGRSKNPRFDTIQKKDAEGTPVDIEVVRADLHLDPSSFDTPAGNLGKYVLDRAKSDPASFSSSLVLTTEMEYRLDSKGRPKVDANGQELPPLWRPTALHASDVVDTGDAVDAFLSPDSLPDAAVRRGCELLDKQFRGKSRRFVQEHCQRWLERYLDQRYGPPPSPKREDRRLAQIEVAPELIAHLTSGTFRVSAGIMPYDAKLVASSYDRDRGVFCLTFWSAYFSAVAEGATIPVLPAPMIEVLSEPEIKSIARIKFEPPTPFEQNTAEPPPANVVVADSGIPALGTPYDPAADPTKRRIRLCQCRKPS